MKKRIFFIFAAIAVVLGLPSCSDDGLPADAVVQYPIKTLIVTVDGRDYTAVPKGLRNDTLAFNVPEGRETATVRTIILADSRATATVADGQEITFVEDAYPIILNQNRADEHKYILSMVYKKPDPVPDFLYVVNSGIKDPDGAASWLDPDNLDSYPKLMPVGEGGKYEGYAALGDYDWMNLSFVKSNRELYYNNPTDGLSGTYGTVPLTENAYDGDDNLFPSAGIWANWAAGSGVWLFRVDAAAGELTALCTQWAVSGTATSGAPQAMTYDKGANRWTATVSLDAGAFGFTTVPVNAGDPTIAYGGSGGMLTEDGPQIAVAEAGNYTVTLDLSAAPDYTYSLLKEGEEPEPDPLPFMYIVNLGISGPDGKAYLDPANRDDRDKYPVIASADDGATFEGYAYLKPYDWMNVSIVESGLKKYYSNDSEGLNGTTSYGHFTLAEKTPSAANYFPTDGLWGPWALGSGVWKFSYDTAAKQLTLLCTQWAVSGSAVTGVQAMTYDAAGRTWTLSATLAQGGFRFTTVPCTEGDPVLTYGQDGKAGELAADGPEIEVAEAGDYTITLDLSTPHAYVYSVVK